MPKENKSAYKSAYIIPYNNRAIESLSAKKFKNKYRPEIRFDNPVANIKGCSLLFNTKTKVKKFYLRYRFRGNNRRYCLGTYSKDYDAKANEQKLYEIKKGCVVKGSWVKTPEEFYRVLPVISKTYGDSTKTVAEVIIEFIRAEFPRKTIKGNISAQSQREFTRFLVGYNERTSHLTHFDDHNGWGRTTLKENSKIKSLDELFKKYPPGVGVKLSKTNEGCFYDHEYSALNIQELVAGHIESYLDENPERSFGQKDNIKDCLSALWNFARKKKYLGVKPGPDPTKGIILTMDEEVKSKASPFNSIVYDLDELAKLDKALHSLRDKRPFQAEGVMMIMCTGLREATVSKLTYDMKTTDEVGDPIIKISRTALKGRSRVGQTDETIDITEAVEPIFGYLQEQLNKPQFKAYRYTPYLFPSTRINKGKLLDSTSDYKISHHCRLSERALLDCFKEAKKIAGISRGSLKTLRKTYDGLANDIAKGNWRIIKGVTNRKTREVHDRNYLFAKPEEVKKVSRQIGKVIRFKKNIS